MAEKDNLDICDKSLYLLQELVDELSFLEKNYKLNRYICISCKTVAISHIIAECGEIFCNKCFPKYYRQSCPYCEITVEPSDTDWEFVTEVLDLKVKCKFIRNGCDQIILLGNYLSHIKSCEFATEKHLPKLTEEDLTTDVYQKLTDDVHHLREALQLMDADNLKNSNNQEMAARKFKEELLENMVSLDKDKAWQTALQKVSKNLTDETELLMRRKIEDLKQEIEESQRVKLSQNVHETNEFRADLETEMRKVTNEMQSKIMHLKEIVATNESQSSNEIQQLKETFMRESTKVTNEMQTDLMKFKASVKKNEEHSSNETKQMRDSLTASMTEATQNNETEIELMNEECNREEETEKHKIEVQILASQDKKEMKELDGRLDGKLANTQTSESHQVIHLEPPETHLTESQHCDKGSADLEQKFLATPSVPLEKFKKFFSKIKETFGKI